MSFHRGSDYIIAGLSVAEVLEMHESGTLDHFIKDKSTDHIVEYSNELSVAQFTAMRLSAEVEMPISKNAWADKFNEYPKCFV